MVEIIKFFINLIKKRKIFYNIQMVFQATNPSKSVLYIFDSLNVRCRCFKYELKSFWLTSRRILLYLTYYSSIIKICSISRIYLTGQVTNRKTFKTVGISMVSYCFKLLPHPKFCEQLQFFEACFNITRTKLSKS